MSNPAPRASTWASVKRNNSQPEYNSMKKYLLAVLAYVVATFGTQAVSHFAVNAQHYASVTYLRKEPIFAFGVLVMFVQGSVLAYLYTQTVGSVRSVAGAVRFGG